MSRGIKGSRDQGIEAERQSSIPNPQSPIRMKILMLTPRFPYPPDRGDRLRSWNELDFLARRHDVWLAGVDERQPREEDLQELRRRCREVAVFVRPRPWSLLRGALSVVGGHSLTEGFFYSRRLARQVRAWSEQIGFDAVLTYSSAMAPYVDLVSATRRVLDMVDVDSCKWRLYAARSRSPARRFYALEAKRLAVLERRGVRHHDICLVVNERERRKLLERTCPKQAAVLRTCVDVGEYTCLNPGIRESRDQGIQGLRDPGIQGSRDLGIGGSRAIPNPQSPISNPQGAPWLLPREPIIGMVGSLFYRPNVQAVNWFGRYVWPLVRKARPDAQWWIVGNRPTRSVRRWGRLADVTVTGYVPDLLPYFARMRVFVNPVESELGVQSKVIVAMAAGRPVVITPGAAAGIDYEGAAPFLIAGSPRGFAEAVIRLLEDDTRALDLAKRGRRVIDENYRVETQLPQLEGWLRPKAAEVGRDRAPAAAPAPKAAARTASSKTPVTHGAGR
jgi:glycosyltransferase involved in cell wall biosynthesis